LDGQSILLKSIEHFLIASLARLIIIIIINCHNFFLSFIQLDSGFSKINKKEKIKKKRKIKNKIKN